MMRAPKFLRRNVPRAPGRSTDNRGQAAVIVKQAHFIPRLKAYRGESRHVQHLPEAIAWMGEVMSVSGSRPCGIKATEDDIQAAGENIRLIGFQIAFPRKALTGTNPFPSRTLFPSDARHLPSSFAASDEDASAGSKLAQAFFSAKVIAVTPAHLGHDLLCQRIMYFGYGHVIGRWPMRHIISSRHYPPVPYPGRKVRSVTE
jgi:hypothetical protein